MVNISVNNAILIVQKGALFPHQIAGSNLCLIESFWKESEKWDSGYRKNAKFRFRLARRATRENCVLVQFVKGEVTECSGVYGVTTMLGTQVDTTTYGTWRIDSGDRDPVYGSSPSSRWNYRKRGNRTYEAEDTVGPVNNVNLNMSLEFFMCIFSSKDVPKDGLGVSPLSLMARSFSCIRWEVNRTCQEGPQ
jgi:hypothetical protein